MLLAPPLHDGYALQWPLPWRPCFDIMFLSRFRFDLGTVGWFVVDGESCDGGGERDHDNDGGFGQLHFGQFLLCPSDRDGRDGGVSGVCVLTGQFVWFGTSFGF